MNNLEKAQFLLSLECLPRKNWNLETKIDSIKKGVFPVITPQEGKILLLENEEEFT